ncbi:MAG: BMC domain-containing protein [Fimbriimonadaceae bacterium]|nr:BMC domain-containing protein [Fimbriimonadaceae bacterium]
MSALGLLEVRTFTASIVVADLITKAAGVELLNLELNDLYGTLLRVTGETSAVQVAIAAGEAAATQLGAAFTGTVVPRPAADGRRFNQAPPVVSWLLGAPDPLYPRPEDDMADQGKALGFVETQGVTACYEALDAMLKAAAVEYVGREKIGGGYVAVIVRGPVSDVTTAVEAGAAAARQVGGNFIASHVIARPHPGVLRMMPRE